MAAVAMGVGNGSGTTKMGNSGSKKMADRMAARWQCVRLQSQWTVAATIGDGREMTT